MTSSAAGSGTLLPLGRPPASIVNPVKRKADVIEMLAYVHSLGIDHVRESEMLWIAEEAFNAPLPPGWTEHIDNDGRTYFYQTSTRLSSWKHPLDEVFQDIVGYWRRILAQGGFWEIDDEIQEIEEKIRNDLSQWMELFDDTGNKFYYNRQTQQSCFDDPRHTAYHGLYTRLRMVNEMKERMPLLALAPRPDGEVEETEDMEKARLELESLHMRTAIKVQSIARMWIARRAAARKKAKHCLDRVPKHLKGKLKLDIRTAAPGSRKKEVVLAVTIDHKRAQAAIKIQALVRGHLARKHTRPKILHMRFLSDNAKKIQRVARIWLSERFERQAARKRMFHALMKIQAWSRGAAARKRCAILREEKSIFLKMCEALVSIQCALRQYWARRRVRRKKIEKYQPPTIELQRAIKVFRAKQMLVDMMMEESPIQAFFTINENPNGQKLMPYTWRLGMIPEKPPEEKAPKKQRPKSILKLKGQDEEPPPPPVAIDLFEKVGMAALQGAAAVEVQRVARGFLGRKEHMRALKAAKETTEAIVSGAADFIVARVASTRKIQRIGRGYLCRKHKILAKKRAAWLASLAEQIETVVRHMERYNDQFYIREEIYLSTLRESATMVQARWRGVMARRVVTRLREESVWPLKGWFEYTSTGRDSVQVAVKFVKNPRFNSQRHFTQYGDIEELHQSLTVMEDEAGRLTQKLLGPRCVTMAKSAAIRARTALRIRAELKAAEEKRQADMRQREQDAMAAEEAYERARLEAWEKAEQERIEREAREEEERLEQEAREEEERLKPEKKRKDLNRKREKKRKD
eukprot:TRINITY_DN24657_c0_g1_i2.p1 TRINITY_DN24657_c0_g1~~TRINITY_DN24657_c0_g1_i2.p1  ORF type:complete len:804 (+),score=175.10 TRINITY_DN24657_c0_g1_i2:204-2615(+)